MVQKLQLGTQTKQNTQTTTNKQKQQTKSKQRETKKRVEGSRWNLHWAALFGSRSVFGTLCCCFCCCFCCGMCVLLVLVLVGFFLFWKDKKPRLALLRVFFSLLFGKKMKEGKKKARIMRSKKQGTRSMSTCFCFNGKTIPLTRNVRNISTCEDISAAKKALHPTKQTERNSNIFRSSKKKERGIFLEFVVGFWKKTFAFVLTQEFILTNGHFFLSPTKLGPTNLKLCWWLFCLCCFARDNTTTKESEEKSPVSCGFPVTKKKRKKKENGFLFFWVWRWKKSEKKKQVIDFLQLKWNRFHFNAKHFNQCHTPKQSPWKNKRKDEKQKKTRKTETKKNPCMCPNNQKWKDFFLKTNKNKTKIKTNGTNKNENQNHNKIKTTNKKKQEQSKNRTK